MAIKISIFVSFLGFAYVALGSKTQMTLESMLMLRAQASGALDTVMSLLQDLKKANENERAEWEGKNKTWEEKGKKMIAQMSEILSVNEKNYQESVEHRQFIDREIQDTEEHIEWIEHRFIDIQRKLEELGVQRCRSNAIFVNSLKQHSDGLKALKIIQGEIQAMQANGELTELHSVTDRLRSYEHLFEKEAISNFLQLANGDDYGLHDPKLDYSSVMNAGQKSIKGTFVEKVYGLLSNLSSSLKSSMRTLEEHEIQAAYDHADFRSSSELENVTLREDHIRKEKYLGTLEIDAEVAREGEDQALTLRDESRLNVDRAMEDLNSRRETCNAALNRIKEEKDLLEAVTTIFNDRVTTMQTSVSKGFESH